MSIDIEQLRADMEVGTDGPWWMQQTYANTYVGIKKADIDSMAFVVARFETHQGIKGDAYRRNLSDARRIARLPDLEQAYLDLHEQNRKLREALGRALPWARLAECLMEDWAAHYDVDAGDRFDWAVRFGVLVPIEGGFNPDIHSDEYGCAEAGDPWYELAPAPAALAEGGEG